MKKLVLAGLILMMVFAGCRPQNAEQTVDRDQIENVQWRIDEVFGIERKSANIIHANSWYSMDAREELEGFLVQGELEKEEPWALGIVYSYEKGEEEELLNLGDGGLAWSKQISNLYGAVNYIREDKGGESVDPYKEITSGNPKLDTIEFSEVWYSNEGYGWKDLEFAAKEEGVKKFTEFYEGLGISLELLEGYALDLETLEMRYEKRLKDYADSIYSKLGPIPEYELPKEEGYLLLFQQMLDGVPCMPYFWRDGWSDYNGYLGSPGVTATIMERGIISLTASELVIPDGVEEREIISYQEAEAEFCELLKEYQLGGNNSVVHAGLFYVGKPGKVTDYEMVPAWAFALYREYEVEAQGNASTEKIAVKEVVWYIMDAVTGEWIKDK